MVEGIGDAPERERKEEMMRDLDRIRELVKCCSFRDEDGSIRTLYAGLELMEQRAAMHQWMRASQTLTMLNLTRKAKRATTYPATLRPSLT